MVDQTTIRGTPVLMAGVRVARRVLPVAFVCYEYATLRKSQNVIEESLFLLIAACLPPGCKPIFILDRGSARASLLRQLRRLKIPFILRGRATTMVRVGGQRLSLGRVRRRAGRARRDTHAAYQDTAQEPVDLIVYHDRAFQEPWFLLVPAGSETPLPTDDVGALYRERMYIELTFRDWKTHLGVRGLRLELDLAPRLGRLLLALTLASMLAVLLGAGPLARRVRAHTEVLRATPRHGTRRRLSARSIAILALSLGRSSPGSPAMHCTASWPPWRAANPRRRFRDDAPANGPNAARVVAARVPAVRERQHPRTHVPQWRQIPLLRGPTPIVDAWSPPSRKAATSTGTSGTAFVTSAWPDRLPSCSAPPHVTRQLWYARLLRVFGDVTERRRSACRGGLKTLGGGKLLRALDILRVNHYM
ncbi:MAG: transposase [Luteitalea sp.]|nr:transposase [Luteitalea sp.]